MLECWCGDITYYILSIKRLFLFQATLLWRCGLSKKPTTESLHGDWPGSVGSFLFKSVLKRIILVCTFFLVLPRIKEFEEFTNAFVHLFCPNLLMIFTPPSSLHNNLPQTFLSFLWDLCQERSRASSSFLACRLGCDKAQQPRGDWRLQWQLW